MPNYFLNLFSPETWKTFQAKKLNISGFNASQESRAKAIAPGDRFICYLTEESKIVGIYEVTSPSFFDSTDIGWGEGKYPVRFRVKPLIMLAGDKEIPIRDLLPRLNEYQRLDSKNRWSSMFRGSLKKFDNADAKTIEDAVQEAAAGYRKESPIIHNTAVPSGDAAQIISRLRKLRAINDAGDISREAFKRHEDRLINEYLNLS